MQKGNLLVSDIFDKNVFYKEIKRDFSPAAVASSAILMVRFEDSNKLMIRYLEGNDFKEKSEIINLNE